MKKKVRCINLGGEGEVPGAINVNLPCLFNPTWRCCRDGKTTVKQIMASGPVVIANGDALPFANNIADKVVTLGVPVGDDDTWLGSKYRPEEIDRILKPGAERIG